MNSAISLSNVQISGSSRSRLLFRITRRDVPLAVGFPLEGGAFRVLSGSRASACPVASFLVSPSVEASRRLRCRLLDLGVLVADDGSPASLSSPPGCAPLRFAQDWVFDSPSSAASVVLAAPANGLVEWTLV